MPHAPRVCSTPGCPTIVTSGHCSTHARPDARAGIYGSAHKAERKRWAVRVATGQVKCWRCNERIAPGESFDLGHDRGVIRGPEHSFCNRSAAGKESHTNWR